MSQHNKISASASATAVATSQRRQSKQNAELENGMNQLLASFNMDRATRAGDLAPPFRWRDNAGKQCSFERLRRDGPLVIVFHRGEWCHYCALELAAIEKAIQEFDAVGASVLVISPQPPKTITESSLIRLTDPRNDIAEKFGLKIVLPDALMSLYRRLGFDMPEFDDDENWTLPISALYVVSREGEVLYSEVHTKFSSHLAPENALKILQANQRRGLSAGQP